MVASRLPASRFLSLAQEMLRKLAQKPPSPTEGSVWQARPLSDPGVVAPLPAAEASGQR